MRKQNAKFQSLIIVVVLIVMTLLASFAVLMSVAAQSNYTGVFVGNTLPADSDIKNETNTYNVDGTKNSNTVSTGEPQLTVLTHGYGSSASDWSNDFEYFNETRKLGIKNDNGDYVTRPKALSFVYDSDSLIEQLRVLSGGADVYLADFSNSNTEFTLKTCFERSEELAAIKAKDIDAITDSDLDSIQYTTGESISQLTDISNHIIVVFDAFDSNESNDYVYNQFDFMMDKLVYDIKILSGGVLPKVNLIGHSRGGITNMQYALDHPDLVDSMFSMGTPYHGSKLGQSEFILNFLNMSNVPSDTRYTNGVGV